MDDFAENLPNDINDDSIFDNAADVDYAITTDEQPTTEEEPIDIENDSSSEEPEEVEQFIPAEPLDLSFFDVEIESLKPTETEEQHTDIKEDIAASAPVTIPDEEEEKQEKSDAIASAIQPISVDSDAVHNVSDKLTAEAITSPMEAYKGANGKYTTTPNVTDLDTDLANFIGDFVGLRPGTEPSELTVVNKNGETVGSVTVEYGTGGKSFIDTFDADGNKLNHFEYATTSNKGSEEEDSWLNTAINKGASMLGVSSDMFSNEPIGDRDVNGVITIGDKENYTFRNYENTVGNEIVLRSDGKGTVADAIGNLVSQSLAKDGGLTQFDIDTLSVGAAAGGKANQLTTTTTNTVGSNEAEKEKAAAEEPVTEKAEEPVPVEKAVEPVAKDVEAERAAKEAEEAERKRVESETADFYESSMPSEEAETTAPVYTDVEEPSSETVDSNDSEAAEPIDTDTEDESSFWDFFQTNAAEMTATGRAFEQLYNSKDSDLANSEVRAEAEDLVAAVGQAWSDVKNAKGAVATVKALGQLAETAKQHIEDLVARAKGTTPYLYTNIAKALIQDTVNGLLLGLGLPAGALNIVGSWFLNKFSGLLKSGSKSSGNGITVNDLKTIADEAGISYDSSITDDALLSSNIDFDTFEADKNAGVDKYNQGLKASDINVKYLYKMSPVIRKVKWSK